MRWAGHLRSLVISCLFKKPQQYHLILTVNKTTVYHLQVTETFTIKGLYNSKGKGKVLPYSLPSVGPTADPSVQAVSPRVTWSHPRGGRLPLHSARPTVTFPAKERHLPNDTAWWQRHMRVSSCPSLLPGSGPTEIQTRDLLDLERMPYY